MVKAENYNFLIILWESENPIGIHGILRVSPTLIKIFLSNVEVITVLLKTLYN